MPEMRRPKGTGDDNQIPFGVTSANYLVAVVLKSWPLLLCRYLQKYLPST